MKIRLLLITLTAITFLAASCSNDDDFDSSCKNKVWLLVKLCSPECTYFIEYGPDKSNTTSIKVNKVTFDYYSGIFNDGDDSDCWEGKK